MTFSNVLMQLDVAIEFRATTSSTCIFFNMLLDYASLFLDFDFLFRQRSLSLSMLFHKTRFLCLSRLNESRAFDFFNLLLMQLIEFFRAR